MKKKEGRKKKERRKKENRKKKWRERERGRERRREKKRGNTLTITGVEPTPTPQYHITSSLSIPKK